jgi:hypothetical protein
MSRQQLEKEIMNEKVLEYVIMGLVSLSGWITAIGHRVLMSSLIEKASQKFILKEIYEKDMEIIRASLKSIETKVDSGMDKLEAKIDKLTD